MLENNATQFDNLVWWEKKVLFRTCDTSVVLLARFKLSGNSNFLCDTHIEWREAHIFTVIQF